MPEPDMSLWKFIGGRMRDVRQAAGRSVLEEATRRGMDANSLIEMEDGKIKPVPAPDSGIPLP
jgi:hypothetical protein